MLRGLCNELFVVSCVSHVISGERWYIHGAWTPQPPNSAAVASGNVTAARLRGLDSNTVCNDFPHLFVKRVVLRTLFNKQLSYGRETARSLIYFRLTPSFIRKITKLHFSTTLWWHQGQYKCLKVSTQRNITARFSRGNVSFICKTAKRHFWRVTYAIPP